MIELLFIVMGKTENFFERKPEPPPIPVEEYRGNGHKSAASGFIKEEKRSFQKEELKKYCFWLSDFVFSF
ncbi:hypothetical protein [Methylacidiphilum kamchatkense]|nr:hypothetical protein [Methylacidiphilum kamchatkense]